MYAGFPILSQMLALLLMVAALAGKAKASFALVFWQLVPLGTESGPRKENSNSNNNRNDDNTNFNAHESNYNKTYKDNDLRSNINL